MRWSIYSRIYILEIKWYEAAALAAESLCVESEGLRYILTFIYIIFTCIPLFTSMGVNFIFMPLCIILFLRYTGDVTIKKCMCLK